MNSVKTITTYHTNDLGQKIKTVRTVKVTKRAIKMAKTVLARRKLAKFGTDKGKPDGFSGRGYTDSGITNLDANEQVLDMTPKARAAEENNESAQRAFEKMNNGTFEAWRPKNRGDGGVSAAKEWAEANGIASRDDLDLGGSRGGAGAGSLEALAAGQGGKSSYVPPSMRNADGSRNTELAAQRDDSCTVRVSNLSEDVKDSDLRELFRRFGPIQRIYLAKDRETHASRGFAFINFFNKEDAQKAIDKLHGHGYDHLILSVTWSNPRCDIHPVPMFPAPARRHHIAMRAVATGCRVIAHFLLTIVPREKVHHQSDPVLCLLQRRAPTWRWWWRRRLSWRR